MRSVETIISACLDRGFNVAPDCVKGLQTLDIDTLFYFLKFMKKNYPEAPVITTQHLDEFLIYHFPNLMRGGVQ